MGEGVVKNQEKLLTSFMDGPLGISFDFRTSPIYIEIASRKSALDKKKKKVALNSLYNQRVFFSVAKMKKRKNSN